MIKKMFICQNIESRIITIDWFWGLEAYNINSEQYFISTFNPKIKWNLFELKLNLPVEINSNGIINDNHWNSPYDIITKINYLQFTNNIFYFKIKTLDSIILGNGELIYDYSNNLFHPLLIKKGMYSGLRGQYFSSSIVIDDLNDWDLFFVNLKFRYNKMVAGTILAYDNDINDPYTEEPDDFNNSIYCFNTYINYKLLKIDKWNIELQNDLIKHLKTYQYDKNIVFSSGPLTTYSQWFSFKLKCKYYQKNLPARIFFNKFYEIERGTNYPLLKKNSIGFSSLLSIKIKKILALSFFIDKIEGYYPYAGVKIDTLEKFFSKIHINVVSYRRYSENLIDTIILWERQNDSFTIWRSYVPLSKNITFNLDYLKSFTYNKNSTLNGFRQTLLYIQFNF